MATRREDLAAALTNAEENGGELAEDFVPPSAEPAEVVEPVEAAPAIEARPRDESGRFAPKAPAETAPEPAASAPAQPAEPAQRPEAPKSWKPEFKATWDKLDPTVAGYITQREQEMQRGVDEYRQKAEPALSVFNEITPFVQAAQQQGFSMQQIAADARQLYTTRAQLQHPDQNVRMQTVLQIAHSCGIPLQEMLQGQIPQGMQQALDPNFMALQQRLQTIEGNLTAQQQFEQQRAQQEIDNEIATFGADAKHPHFQALMPEMARLLQAGVASDLESAYSKALRLNDDLFQQSQAQQRETAEKERKLAADKAAKAARSNAVSTRTATPGSVAASTGGAPKGRRAALEEAFSQATTSRI